MQLPSYVTELLGKLAYEFARVQPLLPTYGHLLLSALFPIYTGSYASLSRPSSAAKQEKKTKPGQSEDGPDEDDERPLKMGGLFPSDAIMFPLLAGATLTGLYFLIKWLQDPALLNKILNWYFAGFSIFSISRLVSDGLDVFHSLLFPHDYIDGGILYHVDPKRRRAVPRGVPNSTSLERTSPLPGIFSRLRLPNRLNSLLWTLHILPTRKLTFATSGSLLGTLKLSLGIHGIEGLAIGLGTVLYYNFVSKPWYLTNLSGFGFAYGALQIMSPTTFTTGTMLLGALLCYDFYMVFRTPMMVTVAKSLDVPIKLLFPRPSEPDDPLASQAMSMLGLGDVVLPGIIIGLALRFDLYLFYLRKQKKIPAPPTPDTATDSTLSASSRAETVQKAPYTPVSESWGDNLWTLRLPLLPSLFSTLSTAAQSYTPRNKFPTPYFTVGLTGYVVGMVATLVAMQVSEQPQPALIYLVPGVLGALWGTAAWRGEVGVMRGFSDAVEEDEEKEKEKEKEEKEKREREEGKETKTEGGESEEKAEDSTEPKHIENQEEEKETKNRPNAADEKDAKPEEKKQTAEADNNKDTKSSTNRNQPRLLFSFSITLPPPYWTAEELRQSQLDTQSTTQAKQTKQVTEVPATPVKEGEHVEKRRRIL